MPARNNRAAARPVDIRGGVRSRDGVKTLDARVYIIVYVYRLFHRIKYFGY